MSCVVQEICSKMHPVSSTNKHHDVTDLVNHGMIKITKTLKLKQNILKLTLNIVFYEIKKNLPVPL